MNLKLANAYIKNIITNKKVFYIVESLPWSIMHDGKSITKNINYATVNIITNGLHRKLIHLGSFNMIFKSDKIRTLNKTNKHILTCFHISDHDERVSFIPAIDQNIDLWHSSCQITKQKLIRFGIDPTRIVVIPLGVDLKIFSPITMDQRKALRQHYGIPNDAIVIGSFQKDGNGWGKGLEPKLIKGPDILCNVIEKLNMQYKLFILLSGPARGYVINHLEKLKIHYQYRYFNDPNHLSEYYRLCDLYLITSRVEGGPKSMLESMASGIPVVSTKVGMANDVIKDGENGLLTEINDTENLCFNAVKIIDDPSLALHMTQNALNTVQNYDWSIIAKRYEKELYQQFLQN